MRTILEIIGTAVVVGLAGGAVGYLVRKNVAEGKIATAEEQAIRIVQDAEQSVKNLHTSSALIAEQNSKIN